MVRKCNCSGGCCGPQTDEVSRRDFLTLSAAGATSAALARAGLGRLAPAASPARGIGPLEKGPLQPSPARALPLRRPQRRPHAPGRHRHRQFRNRLRRSASPTGNCSTRSATARSRWCSSSRPATRVRLLQTAGGQDWPRSQADRDDRRVSHCHAALSRSRVAGQGGAFGLHALCPAWTRDCLRSRWPCSCFASKTPRPRTRRSRWPAMMQNAVGYDAAGAIKGVATQTAAAT